METNKALVFLKAGTDPEIERLTREQVLKLRGTARKAERAFIPLGEHLARSTRCVITEFILAVTPPIDPSLRCRFYGHVLNRTHWSGCFPQCDACGKEIKSARDLRKCIEAAR